MCSIRRYSSYDSVNSNASEQIFDGCFVVRRSVHLFWCIAHLLSGAR